MLPSQEAENAMKGGGLSRQWVAVAAVLLLLFFSLSDGCEHELGELIVGSEFSTWRSGWATTGPMVGLKNQSLTVWSEGHPVWHFVAPVWCSFPHPARLRQKIIF